MSHDHVKAELDIAGSDAYISHGEDPRVVRAEFAPPLRLGPAEDAAIRNSLYGCGTTPKILRTNSQTDPGRVQTLTFTFRSHQLACELTTAEVVREALEALKVRMEQFSGLAQDDQAVPATAAAVA